MLNSLNFRMSKQDKNKSGGGLLDSLFGRPKTKSSTNNSGGTLSGRPVSADGEALNDLQELERKIRGLTDSEVEVKFMEILDDMNIPKDKREPLLAKPKAEQRKMIFMHLKGMLYVLTDKITKTIQVDLRTYSFCFICTLLWCDDGTFDLLLINCR